MTIPVNRQLAAVCVAFAAALLTGCGGGNSTEVGDERSRASPPDANRVMRHFAAVGLPLTIASRNPLRALQRAVLYPKGAGSSPGFTVHVMRDATAAESYLDRAREAGDTRTILISRNVLVFIEADDAPRTKIEAALKRVDNG